MLFQEEKKEEKIRENTEKMEDEIRKLQNDSLESVFIIEEQGAEIRYLSTLLSQKLLHSPFLLLEYFVKIISPL